MLTGYQMFTTGVIMYLGTCISLGLQAHKKQMDLEALLTWMPFSKIMQYTLILIMALALVFAGALNATHRY